MTPNLLPHHPHAHPRLHLHLHLHLQARAPHLAPLSEMRGRASTVSPTHTSPETARCGAPLTVMLAILAFIASLALPIHHAHAQVRGTVEGNSHPVDKSGEGIDPAALADHFNESAEEHARHARHDSSLLPSPEEHAAFATKVNLDDFRKLAVFDEGRAKIIDTLAREHVARIYGKEQWKDLRLSIPTEDAPPAANALGERYDPV